MFKKLSLILAAATLCANMGIAAPVSAQTATEETVLVESNFQNCNLGAYTAANQLDGETDLRNGVVMVDDSDLSTGYTIKNGDSYESISEADIVNDGEEKVLRLNTFLKDSYAWGNNSFPLVKSIGKIPDSGKVKIDIEVKMSARVSFWMFHSVPTDVNWRIWRLEDGGGSESTVKVLYNTPTNKKAVCNEYNLYTVIMDTTTGDMDFYLEDEFLCTAKGKLPAEGRELFFGHMTHTADVYKPIVTYNDQDNTKIESVTNPQYVYVKSLKMTTYTDTAIESVTPANDSTVVEPEEVVFTFNNEIKSVEKAEVYDDSNSEPVDVTESLIIEGKTVRVPYAYAIKKNYKVTLTGVSDGMTSTNAATSFATEWNFSNLAGSPVNTLPEDVNRYFINEDFTNSDDTNIIVEANRNDGWYVGGKGDGVSIVTLDDGNKVLQIQGGDVETLFQIQYNKNLNLLDNTTTISFDVYIEAGTRSFATYREVNGVKYLETNCFKGGWAGKVMTDGQWHKVAITLSDTAGTTLYIDGARIINTPKADGVQGLSATGYFRFVVVQGKVQIDNFKLYLDKNKTELTAVTPAYDATDVSVSDAIEFTYNSEIGDLSGAKLILKPNDTNEATVLTDGNGMTVNSNGNKVKITLADALEENTGYALEFSGIKNRAGSIVDAIKTKFSTVYDSSWEVKEFESTVQSASSKKYSIKVKNETDAAGACMAVAVYDENGYLEDVVFSDPAESSDGWVELDATVNYTDGNTSKIFIWDSVGDMNLISGIITD